MSIVDIESVKAALIVFGLKEGASLGDIRSHYLERTFQPKFQRVIAADEKLKKDFISYHTAYATLLKHYSNTESAAETTYYPVDDIFRLQLNQAIYYYLKQDYLKASEKFQEVHRMDNTNVTVLLHLGLLLLKRKSYYAAEKYFKDVLAVDQDNDDAWFYLGESYFKAGEFQKALNMYETAKQLNPGRAGIAERQKEVAGKLGLKDNKGAQKQSFFAKILGKFLK